MPDQKMNTPFHVKTVAPPFEDPMKIVEKLKLNQTGIKGVGPEAETVYNELGAGQSHLPYRFDLIDPQALFKIAEVLHQGAEKYGANNWRGIPVEDHLNHLIAHAYAYLAGDRSDDHLSHVGCRAIFAAGVALTEGDK